MRPIFSVSKFLALFLAVGIAASLYPQTLLAQSTSDQNGLSALVSRQQQRMDLLEEGIKDVRGTIETELQSIRTEHLYLRCTMCRASAQSHCTCHCTGVVYCTEHPHRAFVPALYIVQGILTEPSHLPTAKCHPAGTASLLYTSFPAFITVSVPALLSYSRRSLSPLENERDESSPVSSLP